MRRRDEAEVPIRAHLGVERRVSGQVADSAAHLERTPHGVDPVDEQPAARGIEVGGQHLEERALAGAIRPHETHDLVAAERETDGVHRHDGGEPLRDRLNGNHEGSISVRRVGSARREERGLPGKKGSLSHPYGKAKGSRMRSRRPEKSNCRMLKVREGCGHHGPIRWPRGPERCSFLEVVS
jgi:hypothetical protein